MAATAPARAQPTVAVRLPPQSARQQHVAAGWARGSQRVAVDDRLRVGEDRLREEAEDRRGALRRGKQVPREHAHHFRGSLHGPRVPPALGYESCFRVCLRNVRYTSVRSDRIRPTNCLESDQKRLVCLVCNQFPIPNS